MVKFVFCLRRLPHLSREEFLDYWLNQHGPLAVSLQKVLGMTKYIQLHTLATPFDDALRSSRGGPEPYDGMVEAWWESLEAVQHALEDPAAQTAWAVLIEDEQRFIDVKNSPLWFAEEHPMIPGPSPT
ncbi:MAG: EthD domain-containing protein [Rhodocyclaceae bacterium]|nr:EthD domain-containing protein [Rhodocyclaceae bacterium]